MSCLRGRLTGYPDAHLAAGVPRTGRVQDRGQDQHDPSASLAQGDEAEYRQDEQPSSIVIQ